MPRPTSTAPGIDEDDKGSTPWAGKGERNVQPEKPQYTRSHSNPEAQLSTGQYLPGCSWLGALHKAAKISQDSRQGAYAQTLMDVIQEALGGHMLSMPGVHSAHEILCIGPLPNVVSCVNVRFSTAITIWNAALIGR